MSQTPEELDALDRCEKYNGGAYQAATETSAGNPYGFDQGGSQRGLWIQMLRDVSLLVRSVARMAADVLGLAGDAADSASDAAASARDASTSADRAATWDPTNYATKDSPTFTGEPKAPTAAPDDDDTSIATTAFVLAQKASAEIVRALTSDTRFVTPKSLADAMAFVSAAASATITPDFAAGFNRLYTMGLNATLGQPTGMKDGLGIVLLFVQDATGGRTLSFSATYHKFPGGTVPTLSTAANAVDRLAGICRNRSGTLVVEWAGIERDVR